tara:strand:+ start:86909 stop:87073 length:165 start_codon:yes stop_codon:yes gene_type:complete
MPELLSQNYTKLKECRKGKGTSYEGKENDKSSILLDVAGSICNNDIRKGLFCIA